ncbi:hypothetical protein EDB89DRAFT_2232638 [Lactarius sanguifluus]|nr:hypothetical protein EDB89DRAFT_2232638 [Lactarius sanguifluus]
MRRPRNGKLASAHTLSAKTLPSTLSLSLHLSVRNVQYSTRIDSPTRARAQALASSSKKRHRSSAIAGTSACASFQEHFSSPSLLNRGIARWPRRTALRKVEQNTTFGSFGAIYAALDVEVAEVEDSKEEDGGMLDGGRCDDCVRTLAIPSSASLPCHLSYHHHCLRQRAPSLVVAFCCWGHPHTIGQLQLRVDRFAIGATALSPSSSSSSASSNPRLVLQVTRPDMCLPGDAPHLEVLCKLDEDQNLDLDSDIGDEDRIIGQIQDFLDENDDILRSKDREQRTASSGPSTTASSRSTSTTNRQFTETPRTSSLTAKPPAHPRTFCLFSQNARGTASA